MCTRDELRSDVGNCLQKLGVHLRKMRELSEDAELVRTHVEMAEAQLQEAAVLWRRSFSEPAEKGGD
jgi:hypothetical protein